MSETTRDFSDTSLSARPPRPSQWRAIRPEIVQRRLTVYAVSRIGLKRRDTVSDLMDLMSERYRFAEAVYYHPKKAAFSAMIAKAIEILAPLRPSVDELDKGSIYPAPWVQIGKIPTEPRHACHFGDESLLAFLSKEAEQAKSESAASLVRGILFRSEYRLIFTLDYEASQGAGGPRKFIDHLRRPDDAQRIRTEETLRALVARSNLTEAVPVLLYRPNIKMQAKEVAAHVELTPNKVVPLSLDGEDPQVAEEIGLLNAKYQRLWRLYIFVHPKLVLGEEPQFGRTSLLSTIVDTFCAPFGVPERARARGSRFEFVPFRKEAPQAPSRMARIPFTQSQAGRADGGEHPKARIRSKSLEGDSSAGSAVPRH